MAGKLSIKDLYKIGFGPSSGFAPIGNNTTLRELPNGGGSYQAPGRAGVLQLNPQQANMARSTAPMTPAAPAPVPQNPVFAGSAPAGSAAPAAPVAPGGPSNIPPQWIKPGGGFYTPDEVAANIANAIPQTGATGDVPNLAGNEFSGTEKTAEQMRAEATLLNNARNDIAVGEKDPFGAAAKSGVAYSPSELAAIEKAYAGVYDPAIATAFSKMEQKRIEEERRATEDFEMKKQDKNNEQRLNELKVQHEYRLREDAANNEAKRAEGIAPDSGDFAGTIDLVSNMEGSVYGKKAVANQLRNMINSKDYSGAYNQIANTVESNLVGEVKQKFANARTDYEVMEGMKNAIEQYAAGGGDMGLLKGTEEQIARKLGIDSGNASELAVQLWREFQTYRNNMTGAAFGAGESRDYESVNPSLKKSLDLNLSVINGAMNQLKNRVKATIEPRVPSAKYIREYAEGATPGGSSAPIDGTSKILSKDGQSFDASDLTPEEYQEAIADGYIAQ